MTQFIYKDIITEFDHYLDNNYSETVYLDTLIVSKYQDLDVNLLCTELETLDNLNFYDVLNQLQAKHLCEHLKAMKKIQKFKILSHDSLEQRKSSANWLCNLNTMSTLDVNINLKNRCLLREVHDSVNEYSSTVQISIKKSNLLYCKDPYDELVDFIQTIDSNKRNENFYLSYSKFYYNDIKAVLDDAIDSIVNHDRHKISSYLPTLYVFAKYDQFPEGTKTRITKLGNVIKKLLNGFPNSMIKDYPVIDTILSINGNHSIDKAKLQQTATFIRKLYNNTCQVCGQKFGEISQAAHIRPLAPQKNSINETGNMLCLCPKHHAMFDRGQFSINEDLSLEGLEGKLIVMPSHKINLENLAYHRQQFTGRFKKE